MMVAVRTAVGAMPDQQMMIETVKLLHPGRVVELRALNLDGRGWTASGYFDQPRALAEAALRANRRAEGVYITLNPLPASLLGRGKNALRERAKDTTSDGDVLRRAYLPIDLDPTRPSGISSSEEEHQAALDQARRVRAWLAEQGWHAPLFADSGNGAHLLYAIDLPNDAASADLIKRCLAALASRFDTPTVTLDRSVYNAARIWKLYGSVARKGEHLPERPHRLARLIETPDPLELVTLAQLEALAALAPSPYAPKGAPQGYAARPTYVGSPPRQGQRSSQAAQAAFVDAAHPQGASLGAAVTEDDLLAWLAAHDALVWRTKREDARALYLLEACPFNADHRRKSLVSLGDDGALGFHCQAASCADHHWHDLKALWGDGPARQRDSTRDSATEVAAAGVPPENPPGGLGYEGAANAVPQGHAGEAPGGQFIGRSSRPWPEPPPDAVYRGLAGEIVRAYQPQTEADPLAILAQLLTAFGAAIGSGPHFMVGEKRHEPRLFTVIAGQSAKARKGDAWHIVKTLLAETRLAPRILTSLSSGEGVVKQVRDDEIRRVPVKGQPGQYEEVIVEVGEPDKRLLVTLTEMAGMFDVLRREGNTLSALLRDAWDHGDLVTATKTDSHRATGAYLALVAHITAEELRQRLTGLDAANGFANRFLWFAVRRGQVLPRPRPLSEAQRSRLAAKLAAAITRARQMGEVDFTPAANLGWERIYARLSEGRGGLAGALLSRGEAQVIRLALLYALLDGASAIDLEHLMAAVGLWEYAERSVDYLFGGRGGDPLAEKIKAALREAGELSRTEINNLVGKQTLSDEVSQMLESLEQQGKIAREMRPPGSRGGRRTEIWRWVE